MKQAHNSVSPQMDAPSSFTGHFAAASLPEPELRCEAPAGGAGTFLYRWMAQREPFTG